MSKVHSIMMKWKINCWITDNNQPVTRCDSSYPVIKSEILLDSPITDTESGFSRLRESSPIMDLPSM